jgi:hypothetical protein
MTDGWGSREFSEGFKCPKRIVNGHELKELGEIFYLIEINLLLLMVNNRASTNLVE